MFYELSDINTWKFDLIVRSSRKRTNFAKISSAMSSVHLKYLTVSPLDLLWGTAVHSVGFQEIAPGMEYPPKEHPSRYVFSTGRGRVLNEYQLLYITKGGGRFSSASLGKGKFIRVEAGMMFLLFPGEWHSYYPDNASGWKEYWIGFTGTFADDLAKNEFFSKDRPIFKVNIREDIVRLYNSAIEIAEAQEAGFQQVLAGIVGRLLSLAYYLDKNSLFKDSGAGDKISEAKVLVYGNYATITPEEIAEKLCISYSSFRKAFKEYTGLSPAKFINDVRMSKAKELLTNSNVSIKEIAYRVGYNNHDYFFTAFRHKTGQTPAEYRVQTQGLGL